MVLSEERGKSTKWLFGKKEYSRNKFNVIKMIIDSKVHVPVMLNEVLEYLNIKEDGTYIDGTFGTGGHSQEILKKLRKGKLVAFE